MVTQLFQCDKSTKVNCELRLVAGIAQTPLDPPQKHAVRVTQTDHKLQ